MGSPDNLPPFYFAWVDSDQTTFVPETMSVVDEAIFDMDITHEEGQCATLTLVIKNPRVGLLSPGRKVWTWLSYQSPGGSGVIPIFFGVLVGIPSDMFAEKVTLKFIARPNDYIEQKQAVAETLKIFPYYDPIFIEETKRDDPDAILEGWSSLYHVDRTTLEVTASDILEGEDHTITFEQDDAFYDSVSLKLDQSPLTNVQVQANVHWMQRFVGFVDGPDVNIQSYTGDTFLADWPKPGTGVGGGWSVEYSFVSDAYKVALTPMANPSASWTNNAIDAADCSTQAITNTSSFPALLSPNPLTAILTSQGQSGVCDPFADPPVNRPATVKVTGIVVPLWVLNCSWRFKYDARRQFSEDVFLNVTANTQNILTSPTVEQDTELIKISGADVGQPLITYEAWSDFAGRTVPFAQLIYPNDPTTPGGLSYQICVISGTAGDTEPVFSDIPGQLIGDGTATWASLGENPQTTIERMTFATSYDVGTIVFYQPQVFNIYTGQLEDIPGEGEYYIATEFTATTSIYTSITYVPPVTNSDEETPTPITVFVEEFTPPSGMVALGPSPGFLGIPIGGNTTEVTANNFFPSDRGQLAIQNLICRARARIRLRARAVKVAWDCPFDLALGLSCRMNATLYDPRLPGSVATGKIISYSLKASGEGRLIGHVEIGCAVGFGGSISEITGTPEYTPGTGYCQPGYQRYDGGVYTLPEEDIGYTPPGYAPFDDGLSFPLAQLPSDGGSISGNIVEQAIAIRASFATERILANLGDQFTFSTTQNSDGQGSSSGYSPSSAWWIEQSQRYYSQYSTPYVMEAHPVSYELLIKPVTNGPFDGAYTVDCTPLEIPQGINLEAASSP